jgi:hypothetical protein
VGTVPVVDTVDPGIAASEQALARAVQGIFALPSLRYAYGDDAVADALGEFANIMWVSVDLHGVDATMALLRAAVRHLDS